MLVLIDQQGNVLSALGDLQAENGLKRKGPDRTLPAFGNRWIKEYQTVFKENDKRWRTAEKLARETRKGAVFSINDLPGRLNLLLAKAADDFIAINHLQCAFSHCPSENQRLLPADHLRV